MEGQDNWNNRHDNNKKKKNLSEPIPPAENKYGSLAPSLSFPSWQHIDMRQQAKM